MTHKKQTSIADVVIPIDYSFIFIWIAAIILGCFMGGIYTYIKTIKEDVKRTADALDQLNYNFEVFTVEWRNR